MFLDVSVVLECVYGFLLLLYIIVSIYSKVKPKSIEVVWKIKCVICFLGFVTGIVYISVIERNILGVAMIILSMFSLLFSLIGRDFAIVKRDYGKEAYNEMVDNMTKNGFID